MTADPQTMSSNFGCKTVSKLLPSTPIVAKYYYYSALKPIFILVITSNSDLLSDGLSRSRTSNWICLVLSPTSLQQRHHHHHYQHHQSFCFWLSGTLALTVERQSARKSKTESDRLASLASHQWISVASVGILSSSGLKQSTKAEGISGAVGGRGSDPTSYGPYGSAKRCSKLASWVRKKIINTQNYLSWYFYTLKFLLQRWCKVPSVVRKKCALVRIFMRSKHSPVRGGATPLVCRCIMVAFCTSLQNTRVHQQLN